MYRYMYPLPAALECGYVLGCSIAVHVGIDMMDFEHSAPYLKFDMLVLGGNCSLDAYTYGT